MDFAFSEEQEFLRSSAREFLERESPIARVRERVDDPDAPGGELFARMAELGWLGLPIPEDLGGAGLGMVELAIVCQEIGRALAPSPFLGTTLGALALLEARPEADEGLARVAEGRRRLALCAPQVRPGLHDETAPLKLDPRAARVSGSQSLVPDALHADALVVFADDGQGGLALVEIERDASGLAVESLDSIDRTRGVAIVRCASVEVRVLRADASDAWPRLRDRALLVLAAEALGGIGRVLDDSVRYASDRKQFGRPIGANQAVQRRCVDVLVAAEASRSLVYWAACLLDADDPQAPMAAAMAKAHASEAYRRATVEQIQIHGGVGFTWEYDCHLFYKRARAVEMTLGDPRWHRARVARMMTA